VTNSPPCYAAKGREQGEHLVPRVPLTPTPWVRAGSANRFHCARRASAVGVWAERKRQLKIATKYYLRTPRPPSSDHRGVLATRTGQP
jgi:hypothetical protein